MFPNSTAIVRQFQGKNFNFCNSVADVCFQSIRWSRKPRWLPMAKSKLFRIPVRPVIPQGEKEELLRIHNAYRTQMRAVRHFLVEEYHANRLSLTNTQSGQSSDLEKKEFENSILENLAWNERVASVRQQRIMEKRKLRDESILQMMTKVEKVKEVRIQAAKEAILKLEEESKTFITRDNLDDAIEHAMSNIVDYNFAIDMEGTIISGRETGPNDVKKLMNDQEV